jgi:antitoxin HicB
MKARKNHNVWSHSGSTFDSFLEQEGIREEVEALAIKRVLAWQLSQAMQEQQKTKEAMAKQLRTSRSQLDRLLDPQNVSVILDTITRAARALGKRLIIRVADVKTKARVVARLTAVARLLTGVATLRCSKGRENDCPIQPAAQSFS